MKITIQGWNYEGAHFRMIASDTDETPHSITLVGEDEALLCDWILESYSYGPMDNVKTLHDLVTAYDTGETPNGDGCGGIAEIIVGDEIMFQWEDVLEMEFSGTVLELGEHVVHETVNIDTLNTIVREAI